MYEGYDFMDEAQIFLKLEAKPEVIEEIKEVGHRNIVKEGIESTDTSRDPIQQVIRNGIIPSFKLSDVFDSPLKGLKEAIAFNMMPKPINHYKRIADTLALNLAEVFRSHLKDINSLTFKIAQDSYSPFKTSIADTEEDSEVESSQKNEPQN